MFLLLLIVLGTANGYAQVRIGSNAAPNTSAVLDLNAGDATTGTKGLVLPRVSLTSPTMLLPGVTSNVTGMMVYNTTTTGAAGVNTVGVYVWTGATWNKANLPSTSAADSGRVLASVNGTWTLIYPGASLTNSLGPYYSTGTSSPVSFSTIFNNTLAFHTNPLGGVAVPITGLLSSDICNNTSDARPLMLNAGNGWLFVENFGSYNGLDSIKINVMCFRYSSKPASTVEWTKVYDTPNLLPVLQPGQTDTLTVSGIAYGDFCMAAQTSQLYATTAPGRVYLTNVTSKATISGLNPNIRCYRPALIN